MIEDQREFHEALERRKRAARAAKDGDVTGQDNNRSTRLFI